MANTLDRLLRLDRPRTEGRVEFLGTLALAAVIFVFLVLAWIRLGTGMAPATRVLWGGLRRAVLGQPGPESAAHPDSPWPARGQR